MVAKGSNPDILPIKIVLHKRYWNLETSLAVFDFSSLYHDDDYNKLLELLLPSTEWNFDYE